MSDVGNWSSSHPRERTAASDGLFAKRLRERFGEFGANEAGMGSAGKSSSRRRSNCGGPVPHKLWLHTAMSCWGNVYNREDVRETAL